MRKTQDFRDEIVESERSNLLLSLLARANDKLKWTYDRCLETFFAADRSTTGCPQSDARGEDLKNDHTGRPAGRLPGAYARHAAVGLPWVGPVDTPMIEHCAALLNRLPRAVRPRLNPGLLPSVCLAADECRDITVKTVEQARLALAYDGLPAYYAHQGGPAVLMNSMLGGDVHSLLFDVIREQMGLAYQVFSMSQRFLSSLFILAGGGA
jgi:hypothetical protein